MTDYEKGLYDGAQQAVERMKTELVSYVRNTCHGGDDIRMLIAKIENFKYSKPYECED